MIIPAGQTGPMQPSIAAGKGGTAASSGMTVPSIVPQAGQRGQSNQNAPVGQRPPRYDRNECQTCKGRKYQDGSNDPGVSFKTPTQISPEVAGSMVRAHEQEHVTREQSKAQREDRKVVSQNVVLRNGICSECGKVYVAGGTTRTVTKGTDDAQNQQNQQQSPYMVGIPGAEAQTGALLNRAV